MTTVGVSRWMFLLVLAHLGCPGQNPQSHKTCVCVCCVQRLQNCFKAHWAT